MHPDRSQVGTWVLATGSLLALLAIVLPAWWVGLQIESLVAPTAWAVLVMGLALVSVYFLRRTDVPISSIIFPTLVLAVVGAAVFLAVQASGTALVWQILADMFLIAVLLGVYGYGITHPRIPYSTSKENRRAPAKWIVTSGVIWLSGGLMALLVEQALTGVADWLSGEWIRQSLQIFTVIWALWPLLQVKRVEYIQQVRLPKFLLVTAVGSLVPGLTAALVGGYSFNAPITVVAIALGAAGGAVINKWLLCMLDAWLRR